jgi:pSer/pThr/pTyr-binding forkhead associated (FHA) protein
MQCTIEHLSGSKKGQIEQFNGDRITVGRNPTNALRFDAMQDLDVSGDHAQLSVGDDGRFMLTDLGSKNGTYLNGQKIAGTVPCEPGSKIQFGKGGPEVRLSYTPGPKKAGATRMLLAQVQQDLEAQKQKAAESKKKATIIGVVAALLLALGGVAFYLHSQHAAKRQGAEVAQKVMEEEALRARGSEAEKYAKEGLAKADDAKGLADAAMEEGRYEDAKAAYEEAKRLYASAADDARREKDRIAFEAALQEARDAQAKLLADMERQAREKDEAIKRRMAELEAQGESAKAELERLKALAENAKTISAKYAESVCFVVAETYVQPEGSTKRSPIGPLTEGTGFAVGPNRIVTAKHVVQPWKFDPKLLGQVKKIKDEHKLDVRTYLTIYTMKNGAFEKSFESGKNKITLIPAHDTWEQAARKVEIEWNQAPVQVEVKPHVPGADDLAAIDIEGADLTPVEIGDFRGVQKGDPVMILGAGWVGKKLVENSVKPDVGDKADDSFTITTGIAGSYAGAPVFTIKDAKCVGVIGAIHDQTITVLPAERAKLLKGGGSTAPGGGMPSEEPGPAETPGRGNR